MRLPYWFTYRRAKLMIGNNKLVCTRQTALHTRQTEMTGLTLLFEVCDFFIYSAPEISKVAFSILPFHKTLQITNKRQTYILTRALYLKPNITTTKG